MNAKEQNIYAEKHAAIMADMADILDAIENMPSPDSATYVDAGELARIAQIVGELAHITGVRVEA